MKIHQNVCTKRYYTYARRSKNEKWSDWTQTNELFTAVEHISYIRKYGFLAKLVDEQTKEVLIND